MNNRRYWTWMLLISMSILVSASTIGHVLAQSVDTTPDVPGFWTDMWEMAKAAGALGSVSFGYIAYRVDKERLRVDAERLKYRDDYNALVERVLPVYSQAVEAQQKLAEIMQSPRKR